MPWPPPSSILIRGSPPRLLYSGSNTAAPGNGLTPILTLRLRSQIPYANHFVHFNTRATLRLGPLYLVCTIGEACLMIIFRLNIDCLGIWSWSRPASCVFRCTYHGIKIKGVLAAAFKVIHTAKSAPQAVQCTTFQVFRNGKAIW